MNDYLVSDPHLAHVFLTENRRFLDQINSAGDAIINLYPQVEVLSWPIQKAEVERLMASDQPSLTMVPFLTQVCAAQFGAASDEERLAQVMTKAEAVNTNANNWAAVAAYLGGLRARTQDRYDLATTAVEILNITVEATMELEEFRRNAGI